VGKRKFLTVDVTNYPDLPEKLAAFVKRVGARGQAQAISILLDMFYGIDFKRLDAVYKMLKKYMPDRIRSYADVINLLLNYVDVVLEKMSPL